MRTVWVLMAAAACVFLMAGCQCSTCRYQYGGSPYGQYQVAPNCEGPCSPFRNSYYYQRGPCERAWSDCPCKIIDAAGLACVDLCDCFRYTCGNQYATGDSMPRCDPAACDAATGYEINGIPWAATDAPPGSVEVWEELGVGAD